MQIKRTYSRQRIWQLKKKRNRLCTICGKSKIYRSERCESCYEPHMIAFRVRSLKITRARRREILQRRKNGRNKTKFGRR